MKIEHSMMYREEGVGGRGLGAVEARTCVLSNTSRRPQKLSQEQNHGLERPRNVLKKNEKSGFLSKQELHSQRKLTILTDYKNFDSFNKCY